MALPLSAAHETILVVDDNPLVLEVVGVTLQRAGYNVLSAASAAEARQIEAEFAGTIHLLLSDVMLFNVFGPDLAAELNVRRPLMRILLMSGRPDDLLTRNFHGDLLRKPFLPMDLLGKVNEVLRREVGVRHSPGSVGSGAGGE